MLRNPRITIIGAGKIAHSLLPALLRNNYNVIQVISKSISSAKKLADKYKINSFTNNLSALQKDSNIFILSVPDSEIQNVSKSLAETGISFKKKLIIHLSGSLTIDELHHLHKVGAYTASMHIMQTFPDKKNTSLKNVYCAIETNDEKVKKILQAIVKRLGMKQLSITSNNKVFYHLAGVFASNFLNANFLAAASMFENIDAGKDSYRKVLGTTSTTTLHNILSKGYAVALSGPVERGDLFTIKKHITVLKKNKKNNLLKDFYISGSLLLLEIAKEKGTIKKSKYEELKRLLLS